MTAQELPLDARDFAGLMAGFAPFEPAPTIAVATSGGADSLALVLLADAWSRACGGRVVALTVDHGLRPESADEARTVGGWLSSVGIEHIVLPWRCGAPTSGVQARARAARYKLLETWCVGAGVLHLLLGHQQDDQAETYLMRRRRPRGYGLAGMAAIVERRGVRLLRPLLGVPRARIEAALRRRGQPWIEDPSNRDDRYERVRVRALAARLARRGWPADRLAARVAEQGRRRQAVERAILDLCGRAMRLDPAGFATLDPAAWNADPEVQALALGRVLAAAGGLAYPPAARSCRRLAATLGVDMRAATLGGCIVRPWRGSILVQREPRAARDAIPLRPGTALWDGRFAIIAPGPIPEGLVVRRLGPDGDRQVRADAGTRPWPAAVSWSLPALWRLDEVQAVPHLHVNRLGTEFRGCLCIRFRPRQALFAPHLAVRGNASRRGRAW